MSEEMQVKIGIGQTVWVFDSNYRLYDENKRIIYREHFRPVEIEAETTRSWVISYQGRKFNISKKTGKIGAATWLAMSDTIFCTEEEIDRQCWIKDNRHEIAKQVSYCKDYETLRQIEALLEAANKE